MISIKPLTEESIKKLKINDKDSEYFFVCNIQGQIRTWLSKNRYNIKEVNTLLLNKLLYYITKELNQTYDGIRVSGGWFRYGPCLEEYRVRGEEGTQDLTLIDISDDPYMLPQVKEVCEIEIPLFFKYFKQDLDNKYFYHYLKHIYTDRYEYDELKDYYMGKNELAYSYLQFAFKQDLDDNLKKSFLNFERAILNKTYTNFVHIHNTTIELVFDYLTVMKKLVEIAPEKKSDSSFWFVAKKIAADFEKKVLGEFSYNNYLVTYRDINKKKEDISKKNFTSEIGRYEELIKSEMSSNIQWVSELLKT